MDPARLFEIANLTALAGWLMLAIAPLRRTLLVNAARVVGVGLAVTYTVLLAGVLLTLGEGGRELDFSSLEGVTRAFAQPEGVLVGWVHYLAFDLWVGAWEVEDAERRGLPHWALLPCLFFTLMFGPFGLLLYLAISRSPLARRRA
ncbi:ABA4-like family protein [Brevundimonas balnearis]|uniref:ABA4-like family protein n=1 Tax=Brevundimonas balnearis TaxID=1572858 RepID=A0ABV6R8B6_9CAUL